MTRDDIICMARESNLMDSRDDWGSVPIEYEVAINAFAELVRADERWLSSQRRGVLMFNPYTGTPRHPSDVASDPHGILMLDPEQPIRAARSNT